MGEINFRENMTSLSYLGCIKNVLCRRDHPGISGLISGKLQLNKFSQKSVPFEPLRTPSDARHVYLYTNISGIAIIITTALDR